MKKTTVSHDELSAFLDVVVAQKGSGAEARPGQVALAHDILDALNARTTFSGVAPPGTGKSFAYLSCAALLATTGQRVLVGTEMLGLQRQIVGIDLPMVARALNQYCGFPLRYASFMGVSNYVDPGRLLGMVEGLTAGGWSSQARTVSLEDLGTAREALLTGFDATFVPSTSSASQSDISGAAVLRELTLWGLDTYLDGGLGSRSAMEAAVTATAGDWQLVAAGSDSRTRKEDLDGVVHKYDEAREYARSASIVVANHALLGIEAVTQGGVVMETVTTGTFDHVIIDEAHALPTGIRNAGKGKVSGASFRELGARAQRLLNDYDSGTWMNAYADKLDAHLAAAVAAGGTSGTLLVESTSPGVLPATFVEEGLALLHGIAKDLEAMADNAKVRIEHRQQARRAEASADNLRSALRISQRPQDETSDVFVARWVESRNDVSAMFHTPIPVDGLAKTALWRKPSSEIPRGVVCVSATLPAGFGVQMGVAEPVHYPSPFAQAFAESAVYVPSCPDPAAAGLLGPNGKFDTQLHPVWASPQIVELVRANDGRALVISATTNGAMRYARDLEKALAGTGITVYNQAAGRDQALTSFQDDERSVLVGTRSYMTGIDVSGESLSLVILDRPPRSPGTVVDDARVARVMREKGCSQMDAQMDVYVADAAALLDQARGRLIRHSEDRGMVAVLDPRIHTSWPLGWPRLTEQMRYFEPLVEFGTRILDLGTAVTWAQGRRLRTQQQAQIAELTRQLEHMTSLGAALDVGVSDVLDLASAQVS